jgi:very-short-patch-repair endonuclease
MKKIDYHNKLLVAPAKELRKNMTPYEKKLYKEFLFNLDIHVYKQRIMYNTIVDFYIPKCKLIIEVDGEYHNEQNQLEKDKSRDVSFKELGFTLIRIPNKSIESDFENVKIKLKYIINKLKVKYEKPLPL